MARGLSSSNRHSSFAESADPDAVAVGSKRGRSLIATFLSTAVLLAGAWITSLGQTAPPPDQKLALRAALILTPEFCATTSPTGAGKFNSGQAACADLEPALGNVFSVVTSVATDSPWESSLGKDVGIVLRPRIAEVRFQPSEMLVVLEWSAFTSSGKMIWVQKAKGSALHRGSYGLSISGARKTERQMFEDAMKGALDQSAKMISAAISASPEKYETLSVATSTAPRVAEAGKPASEPDAKPSPPRESGSAPNPHIQTSLGATSVNFTLDYARSDKLFKHNFRKTPYDEISQEIDQQLALMLASKGIHRTKGTEGVCCKLAIELLSVRLIGNGVSIDAKFKFADGNGQLIYEDTYRGIGTVQGGMESVSKVATTSALVLCKSISDDSRFDQALTKGLNAGIQ
jgi:hypothetical protein